MNRRELIVSAGALTLMAGATAAQAAEPYKWQSVPFGGGGFVDGFVYHPKEANLLYARTDIGGMYRFDYANKRWIPLLDHLGKPDADLMGVLAVALDPNDPNKVYALCGLYVHQWARMGAVLRSNDRGATWEKTELSIRIGGNWEGRGSGERLAVDPNDGNTLIMGSSQDGVWKSTNGGKTFSKTSAPFSRATLVIFDPTTPGTVYAGAFDKPGLFVSRNGGESWSRVEGSPDMAPQRAVFDAQGTLHVTFAMGDPRWAPNPGNAQKGGVYTLSKAGKWSNITPVAPGANNIHFGYSGIDIDPTRPGVIVTSTIERWYPGDDMFVTSDGGKTWMALGDKSKHDASAYPWLVSYLGGEDKMGHWLADLKINPHNPDELIYGTGYGLWMSRNFTHAGKETLAWDFNVDNFEETAVLSLVSPSGGAILMAAMGDVGGAAWDDIGKTPGIGIFAPTKENNHSVDYAGLNPSLVVRTANNSPGNGFISYDGGASWVAMPSTPHRNKDAQGNWRNAGTIAVSANGTSMVWAPEKQGGFYSKDGGRTWTPSQGWPSGRDMNMVPLSDKTLDGVFYVYDRYSNAILISIDGGVSFKPIVAGMSKIEGWQGLQLAVVPGRARDLWLAAPYGLVHSPSADAPVQAVKGVDEAWAIGFGKAKTEGDYPAVYLWGKVKGADGLWRSDDEGKSWVRINDDAHQFGHFQAITGDMLEYGTVYVAGHGRGVLVGRPQ